MPKITKRAKKSSSDDDSSSDSGPEDRNPPPSKKAKAAPAAAPSKRTATNQKSDEEPTWTLDRNRQLKVREFRGKVLIDIREYYEKDGQLLPGKKGISLSATQWQKLKEIIPEVDEAMKNS